MVSGSSLVDWILGKLIGQYCKSGNIRGGFIEPFSRVKTKT